jgi:hypothetical protein
MRAPRRAAAAPRRTVRLAGERARSRAGRVSPGCRVQLEAVSRSTHATPPPPFPPVPPPKPHPPQQVPPPGQPRESFTLVALLNTGALWGYAGGLNGVPSPELLAVTVPWERPAPRPALRQPAGGGELAAGGPAGFWSGGVSGWRGGAAAKKLQAGRVEVASGGAQPAAASCPLHAADPQANANGPVTCLTLRHSSPHPAP